MALLVTRITGFASFSTRAAILQTRKSRSAGFARYELVLVSRNNSHGHCSSGLSGRVELHDLDRLEHVHLAARGDDRAVGHEAGRGVKTVGGDDRVAGQPGCPPAVAA